MAGSLAVECRADVVRLDDAIDGEQDPAERASGVNAVLDSQQQLLHLVAPDVGPEKRKRRLSAEADLGAFQPAERAPTATGSAGAASWNGRRLTRTVPGYEAVSAS